MRTVPIRLFALLTVLSAPSWWASPAFCGDVSLPVLRSHSRTIDVRDGEVFSAGLWQADPASSLDVFVPRRSAMPRRVTFRSDRDSISFVLEPGASRDFIVRIDDSLDCRTRIAAVRLAARRTDGSTGPVEVPFRFGSDHKLHVRGSVNDSAPLDFMFDTGAHAIELSRGPRLADARLHMDRAMEFRGTGGSAQGHASDDNRFTLGTLAWSHEPVEVIEQRFPEFDGILGFSPFEDRVIELDFTRMRFVVSDTLPALGAGWTRMPLTWHGTLPCIDVGIPTPNGAVTRAFVLDTGSNGTLNFGPASASALGLPGPYPRRGSARASGVGSNAVRVERFILPSLTLAGVSLREVPVLAQTRALADREVRSTIGLEILRRFDLVIDYPGNAVYLRPNASRGDAYPRRVLGGALSVPIVLLAGILVIVVAAVAVLRPRRSAKATVLADSESGGSAA